MDSFEWNKVAGAVLFALLLSVGVSIFSETLFHTEAPETPGFIVAVATEEGAAGGGEAAPQPIGTLLAAADAHAGEADAKKCAACHTFDAGGANKVGPNLYGVVNRPIAAHEGFEYDDAMKAFAEQAKTWTFDNLNTFLIDPKKTVPGTKMAFAGLKDDAERANVIAYLRTLSDSPAPLPEAAEAAPATEVASAEHSASATDAGTSAAQAEAAPENAMPTAQKPPQQETPAATTPAQTESASPADQPALSNAPAEQQAAPAEPTPTAPPEQPAQAEAPAPAEQPAQAEAPAAPATPAEQQVAQAEVPVAPAAEAPAAAPAATGTGDATKGANFAKRCAACHSFKDGGPNQVGPHLFGVVGRPVASIADFSYSDAMKKFAEGGKVWDDATLDTYLTNPKGVVPGSKMAFPGIKAEADRANVIAYLNTLN